MLALILAQIALTSDVGPIVYVGRGNCKSQVVNLSWDLGAGNPAAGFEVDVLHARSTSTCSSGTQATAPDLFQVASSQGETGTDSVTASQMILDADAGLPGGCDDTTVGSASPWITFYCVELRPTAGGAATFASVQFSFALANPTPPAGIVVQPGDQHLKLDWTAGNAAENIASYDVHVLLPDAGFDPGRHADHVSEEASSDVTADDYGNALQNGVAYGISIVANDAYGNASDPADGGVGVPKHILDFYDLYKTQGGEAAGGCASTGGGMWVLLGALAVLIRRRKGAALIAALTCLAPAARAEGRDFLVALKIDRYDPKVDSEPALVAQGATPYHDIFGTRAPLRWQLEGDWEVAHPFGAILLGATVGYWQNYGKGLTADTLQPSGDTALLDVIPFGAIVTWRFDWLADHWARFPLIPYAQAGLMRALWMSFNGTGAISHDPATNTRGSGWTSGYTTALGIAFSLDALDGDLSREERMDTGIQRTALFAEYGWTHLDDFGRAGALVLTDHAWRFGLSVEF